VQRFNVSVELDGCAADLQAAPIVMSAFSLFRGGVS
jgi:hypothetical protein